MSTAYRIRRSDLTRKVREVFKRVQTGQPVVVERRGQPEAVILDITDYRILRAVMAYHAHPPQIDPLAGLSDEEVEGLEDIQERYNLVIAHYLAGSISLGRAAELLGISWFDLRERFRRLDVPLRLGPETVEEAKEEVHALREWMSEAP